MAESCEQCESAAECFCVCGGEERLLCKVCYFDHFTTLTDRTHAPYHVTAYAYRGIPGYFQRLQARSSTLPSTKEHLLRNIQTLTQCIDEFRNQVEAFITALREFADTKTAELQEIQNQLEHDLQASYEEVQRTFYEDEPVLQQRFSAALRSGDREMQLFSYEVHSTAPESAVQVTYSLDDLAVSEETEGKLFAVSGCDWTEFMLPSGESQATSLTEEFGPGYYVCVLDDNQAVLLGDRAFLLSLDSKELVQLDSPSTSRLYSGVIRCESQVYVFGGTPATCSCEFLDLDQRTWSSLSDMQYPRKAFTPCLHSTKIYLADTTQSHRAIEIYHLDQEVFETIDVKLPGDLQGDSVSWMTETELVVLTSGGQVGRWRVDSKEWTEAKAQGGWSCCGPLLLAGEMWWVGAEGRLLKYALES